VTSWPRAALLSLSDKTGASEFAQVLAEHGTKLIATGGTAKHLEDAGLSVTTVEQWTGFPEMLGGRIKTLHPHVHGAILARREVAEDLSALQARGVSPIDLVAVTLYPFEQNAPGRPEREAVEEIDIGGVALLRAAAKNFADVIVVSDPAQYGPVLESLRDGGTTPGQRREWATAAFARTARYDAAIATELAGRTPDPWPSRVLLPLERVRGLRYGENPHQLAAVYARPGEESALHAWREGKELSYNNLLDVHAAVSLVGSFEAPACTIVKHNEPCGVACAETVGEAYRKALASDALSAYGGIVAFNRPLDTATAEELAKQFIEVVVAPDFEPGFGTAFKDKKNLRVLRLTREDVAHTVDWNLRVAGPWWLLQRDSSEPEPPWRTVTQRAPTPDEMGALRFAWKVVAAARSNAIVIARETQLIGLGAGQTSRVDAVDLALLKAHRAGHQPKGSVLASDGFFPFADTAEHAAEAGVTAIVQPGGSVRDAEVIGVCDKNGVAMVFTDRRVFRH
jgi:phosphoribosylaminoimidazolecarboxamide formyltransferase/IMP cyclohydrolase